MIKVYSKILVPVDGSETSMKAFRHAMGLAKIHEAEVTMLTVFAEFSFPFGAQYDLWAEESRDNYVAKVLGEMNAALQEHVDEGLRGSVDTRIEWGRPASVITSIAEEEGYDLIMIGSRGLGRIQGMLLGSVSMEVINASNVPVLVIKADEGQPQPKKNI